MDTITDFAALEAKFVDTVDLTDATTVTLSLAQALSLANSDIALAGATDKIIISDTQANFDDGLTSDNIALLKTLGAGTITIKASDATEVNLTLAQVLAMAGANPLR